MTRQELDLKINQIWEQTVTKTRPAYAFTDVKGKVSLDADNGFYWFMSDYGNSYWLTASEFEVIERRTNKR